MAESNTQNAIRLTDWLILAFVVVVMILLIVDLGGNVMDILNRSQQPVRVSTAPADVPEQPESVPPSASLAPGP
jgi:hypothetical protein